MFFFSKYIELEDKRPSGCFLLALAEVVLGPLVKMVTDRVSREGPSGICVLTALCILDVMDLLICVFLTLSKNCVKNSVLRGANEALIVRYPTYKGRVSLEDSLLMVGN